MSMQTSNIASASLIMATDPTPEMVERVQSAFEKKLQSTLEFETQCDPSIMGGFIFTLNGWQYDASIASALKSIKKQLQAE
jgi:F-type H+-transporting ATPase subunit delta